MKQILEIGYTTLVLPESANLNAILKALGGAKIAETKHGELEEKYVEFYHLKGSPKIEIKLVEDRFVIDPNKRKAIPQHTGGPY